MATTETGNTTFKWLEKDDKRRDGDVVFAFKSGRRLGVRPASGCSKCGGRGWDKTKTIGQTRVQMACECMKGVVATQCRASKESSEIVGVDYSAVLDSDRQRILTLEGEMEQIRAESVALDEKAKANAERYAKLVVDEQAHVETLNTTLKETTDSIVALEEGRTLLTRQKKTIEKSLADNRAAIEAKQNMAMKVLAEVKQAQHSIEQSKALAALLAGGDKGERAEKLKKALTKREEVVAKLKQRIATMVEPPPAIQDESRPAEKLVAAD